MPHIANISNFFTKGEDHEHSGVGLVEISNILRCTVKFSVEQKPLRGLQTLQRSQTGRYLSTVKVLRKGRYDISRNFNV